MDAVPVIVDEEIKPPSYSSEEERSGSGSSVLSSGFEGVSLHLGLARSEQGRREACGTDCIVC